MNSKPFRYQLSSFVNVNHIDFSYNPIDMGNPNATGIGQETTPLKLILMHLSFGGIGSVETNCSKIVFGFLDLMHIFIMSMKLK